MSAPSPSCPDDAAARRLARSMAVVSAFCLTGDTMLYIALPLFWQECGLTALWQVGVLLAVNRLVRLLYTRIDQRTGMALAVVLAASTTLLYGVAQSFALWLLLRCLWGLAWTLLRLGSLFALMAASRKDNRGYLMGSYNGLVRLGSLLGMIGGGLLADLLGFSTVALLFGALTLTGLPLALTRIPRSGRATGAASQAATSLLSGLHLRHPDMRRAFITGLLVALVFQGIYAATLSRMVALHVGELALAGGLVIGCATLAGTLQALRWLWEPWLAPWFGRLSDGPRGRGPVLCAGPGGPVPARALVAAAAALLAALRHGPGHPLRCRRLGYGRTARPSHAYAGLLCLHRGLRRGCGPGTGLQRAGPLGHGCCLPRGSGPVALPAAALDAQGSGTGPILNRNTSDFRQMELPANKVPVNGNKKICQKMIFLLTGRGLLARKDFSHG